MEEPRLNLILATTHYPRVAHQWQYPKLCIITQICTSQLISNETPHITTREVFRAVVLYR